MDRHDALYSTSHGWDERFTAMVRRIVDDLARTFDSTHEQVWIAELDGRRVGAIALVRGSGTVAHLRLFFVEPEARGHGIGRLLVSTCVARAREVGYGSMTLQTVRSLEAAGHLYRDHGFRVVEESVGQAWGKEHVDQTWTLEL